MVKIESIFLEFPSFVRHFSLLKDAMQTADCSRIRRIHTYV